MKNFLSLILIIIVTSCAPSSEQTLTNEDLEEFLANVESENKKDGPVIYSASWISSNFITYDSQKVIADYGTKYTLKSLERSREAAGFDGLDISKENQRMLNILKSSFVMPPPLDEELASELSEITTSLEAMYGRGEYCFDDEECYDLEAFESIIDNSRDPKELLRAWEGWHEIGKPMKPMYMRMVDIGNQGSVDLGYEGLSDLWFSKYDMPAEDFLDDTDRVWSEVKPLYEALHCHVRAKLNEHYGDEVISKTGPLPVHMLGNMWGQSWSNIYDLVYEEKPDSKYIDVTKIINEKSLSEIEMVEYAEDFFISMGFKPLPKTFWERSLFVKPRDRSVVCHASAWNLDPVNNDLRIKMCIEKNEEDFITIHHELGHIFYYQAYNHIPTVFQAGANDGFHEAFGDLLTLSITPDYLVDIGFISKDDADEAKQDPIGLLMKQALDGVVIVPWALMLDKWRSGVFDGDIDESNLNSSWWSLREEYQGINTSYERSENYFDPGAKYHIPGNTPYTRYYLASIMQYQFHEALCNLIDYDGYLHECSIYGNKEAGDRIITTMAMGQSLPWQDAFENLTGTRQLSGKSIMNYYAPLKEWLDEENKNRTCGWSEK
ncbi:MAG: peptidase M2 family protein [SAR86 cluster bacterium]|jgi:peptidyl-dipeptidase A|uniref:Peptidase M2 family protein n=1 Tax=SAR86 cluster bacterium TaxID=2030880 RepID=A0A520N441_9GAMM|nr:MAG: peptidase M2 family protein [SAR86 cluster bacterium]|tara:strand:+ start:11015 stop:12832 length:1818 start_codon:yes stop_codon:yes gene_type:complete